VKGAAGIRRRVEEPERRFGLAVRRCHPDDMRAMLIIDGDGGSILGAAIDLPVVVADALRRRE
jgi:hypothetical protein